MLLSSKCYQCWHPRVPNKCETLILFLLPLNSRKRSNSHDRDKHRRCYLPTLIPTKKPHLSPSQLFPRTKPQELHKPERPSAPACSLPGRKSRRVHRETLKTRSMRREARCPGEMNARRPMGLKDGEGVARTHLYDFYPSLPVEENKENKGYSAVRKHPSRTFTTAS